MNPEQEGAVRTPSTHRRIVAHLPEYLMEAFGVAAFMVSAGAFATLLEAHGSPVRDAIAEPTLRRGVMGLAMGLTAIALVYSPWGRRSGAHLNPAVTLAFWRLGRVSGGDALGYGVAHFAGAIVGVALMSAVIGAPFADPPVRYVATLPGERGAGVAFVAELAISSLLMLAVLRVADSEKHAPAAGVVAGALVCLFVAVEAPLSGMSMNPARTLGSALPSGHWEALWIYLLAPVLGMLGAAEIHRARRQGPARRTGCAKLFHATDRRCIHCGFEPRSSGRPVRWHALSSEFRER